MASKTGKLNTNIRWMIRRDMPEVLQIEADCYNATWSEEDFLRALRQRNCIGMVIEQGEIVIGFMIYELHKGHIRVLNLAVNPRFHRWGVGTALIAKLISKLSYNRRTKIVMNVRESNLAAQLFLAKQGFKAVKVVRQRYEDTNEDAYSFRYKITEDISDAEDSNDTASDF